MRGGGGACLDARAQRLPPSVTTGPDPVVHIGSPHAGIIGRSSFTAAWIAGSSPAMTKNKRAQNFDRPLPFSQRVFRASDQTKALKSLPMRGEQACFPLSSEALGGPALRSFSEGGKQNAGKPRQRTQPHLFQMRRRAESAARLPAGVPPRLSPEGLPVPKAQVQARLPGTRFPRALPAVACPSPVAAPHAPVLVPASMMPGPARERSVWLRPRAPHPLHLGEYPRPKVPLSERDLALRTETGT